MSREASASSTNALTVFRLAAGFTFLAVAIGSTVCATESGAACPTWPGCYPEQVVPGAELNPVIEFAHRLVAIGVAPLVLAAALMAWRLPGAARSVRVLPWVALAGVVAAGTFGRLVVLRGLPTWLGAVDLLCALTALTAMGVAAVLVGSSGRPAVGTLWRPGGPQAGQLAAASVVTLTALHVSGIFAAGARSYTRCLGWPLLRLVAGDPHPRLQVVRLGLAGVVAVLIAGTVRAAVRVVRLRRWGTAVAILLSAEMAVGLLLGGGSGAGLKAVYSVLAVALLWTLALLAAVAVAALSEGAAESPKRGRHVDLGRAS